MLILGDFKYGVTDRTFCLLTVASTDRTPFDQQTQSKAWFWVLRRLPAGMSSANDCEADHCRPAFLRITEKLSALIGAVCFLPWLIQECQCAASEVQLLTKPYCEIAFLRHHCVYKDLSVYCHLLQVKEDLSWVRPPVEFPLEGGANYLGKKKCRSPCMC